MPTPQQSANEILTLFIGSGARPGRTFPVLVSGSPFTIAEFRGALQAAFLTAGYAISDLIAGLAYAVTQGWLTAGQSFGAGYIDTYVLEQSGFAQAGGAAPTPAASAQQIINVFAAANNGPNGTLFKARDWLNAFVGTVGGNTFAPEDLMPGAWHAVAQGWLRPGSWDPFEAAFILTAAGAAQAT